MRQIGKIIERLRTANQQGLTDLVMPMDELDMFVALTVACLNDDKQGVINALAAGIEGGLINEDSDPTKQG